MQILPKFNYKLFTYTQNELYSYCAAFLGARRKNVICGNGFIYSRGSQPLTLIAHLDTVWDAPPALLYVRNGQLLAKKGLGADDRAGVCVILRLLDEGCDPSIIFLCDEEKFGIGARKMIKSGIRPPAGPLIELDRHGPFQFVTYDDDSEKLAKYVAKFGWKRDTGTFSDIAFLAPAWNLPAVNLSIGYYNEHTYDEYVNLAEMEESTQRLVRFCEAQRFTT